MRPIRVRAAQEGMKVVDFLHHRMPYRDTEFWLQRIQAGRVLFSGKAVSADTTLKAGQELIHWVEAQVEPSVPAEIEILHDSQHLLVVHKHAPLPMHPGGRYHRNSLTHLLQQQLGYPLFIVHRLDAVTSGLVLLSKEAAYARELTLSFASKRVKKQYLALCKFPSSVSVPEIGAEWHCKAPIARQESFVFGCGAHLTGAKEAETLFRLVKKWPNSPYAQIVCTPITGRTHQIRLHCEAMGHPIVADAIYNGSEQPPRKERRQQWAICLQSSLLEIPHLKLKWALQSPSEWEEPAKLDLLFKT